MELLDQKPAVSLSGLSYWEVNKLDYYCFMSAGRGHETSGSEIKDLLMGREVG